MAHQWFGDLVTMAWWDDLWLNEGFASWMETKATRAASTPNGTRCSTAVDGRETAMALDASPPPTRSCSTIATVEQANQAFDAITYQKGEAVIRMLEAYVGEDAWRRRRARATSRAHAYGNTMTDDLWRAIEAAGAPA